MVDRREEWLIVAPRTQGAYSAAVPSRGVLNGGGEFLHPSAVIHRGQCIQKQLIGLSRHHGSPLQIGYSPAHGPPLEGVFPASFFGPIDTKVLHSIEGGFSSPQHAAIRAIRLVVKLDGVSIELVFDSISFLV